MLKTITTEDAELNIVQENVKQECERLDALIPRARVTSVIVTANYQAVASDRVLLCSSASTLNVTLPDVAASKGIIIRVKNTGGANVNVGGLYIAGVPQTVDGQSPFVLAAGKAATCYSDGTAWWVL